MSATGGRSAEGSICRGMDDDKLGTAACDSADNNIIGRLPMRDIHKAIYEMV